MRILCIGAHPDDCEIKFGGTAVKFARAGHAVKFLSVTNGASGHHEKFGRELARVRRCESRQAAERLGIAEAEVLGSPDGALRPDLETRWEIIRQIRRWRADVVLTHRSCDYHPDHRYTSQLVQDAAYLVLVPAICPEVAPLKINPVFVYFEDQFQLPYPFHADVAVQIDDVWCCKVFAMDAHASQFYEWLPWIDGQSDQVPRDPEARRKWLSAKWERIAHTEAFQLCEYGRQPSHAELERMFPC